MQNHKTKITLNFFRTHDQTNYLLKKKRFQVYLT